MNRLELIEDYINKEDDVSKLIKDFILTKEDLIGLKLPNLRKMRINTSREDILNDITNDSFLELADKNDKKSDIEFFDSLSIEYLLNNNGIYNSR